MVFEGVRNFKDQSYPPPPSFTETNVAPGSQNGRVVLVTGGNAGLGLGLCKILYGAGATVYMASRSRERAEQAIKSITDEKGSTGGKLVFLQLDLNDLESVKAAARTFAEKESKLDVLWNNAGGGGYQVKEGARTVQGFEPMMGWHCIATLLFTTLLLPQLQAAANAERERSGAFGGQTRVLWMSSGMAETDTPKFGIDFDQLEGTNRIKNYAMSKAGVWFLGREFARRYASDGILSLPVNPGNLKTNSRAGTPAPLMWVFNAVMLHDAIFGTYTALFAGISPALTMEHSGQHIIPWGRIHPDDKIKPRRDLLEAMKPVEEGGLGFAAKLWDWCQAKWQPWI